MSICPECSTALRSDGNCSACLLRLASSHYCEDSAAKPADIPESLRNHFPQLEILRVVGQGGMGVVYQARQTSLDRDIALKVIDRSISNDAAFVNRFDREAKALARLSHPNIVAVHDYGRTSDGLAYLMMEYVQGLNLREAMQAMSIDISFAREIIEAVSRALEFAHSKGVVHRDIKPENILLSDDGRIKLADFGIAKIHDGEHRDRKITATNQVLGTAHYLAPEQLTERKEVDHRVDIYALGVILYELLTGQLPMGNFDAPSRMNQAVSTEVDGVLMKALQQRPTARYQSVEEFRLALQQCPSLRVPESHPEQSVSQPLMTASVPFYCPGYNCWSIVHGTARVGEDGIQVEYRSQDKIIGQIRSRLRTATIPWERLVRVTFRPGIFEGMLQINGDSFNLLENFPGSENGCLQLHIIKNNQEIAEKVIQRIAVCQPHLVTAATTRFKLPESLVVPIPVLCILFAVLNAGLLAIAETAVTTSSLPSHHKAMALVFFAVCFAPIAIAQLVTGIVYAGTGARAVGQAAAVVCMLPLSPIAVASIPFGLWARKQLQPAQIGVVAKKPGSTGWGLTTAFFSAESKYARLSSIVESVACIVVVCGIALWLLGMYPTTMRFRIIGQADPSEIATFVRSRLQDIGTDTFWQTDDRCEIVTLSRWSDKVADQLAITEAPTLVICADSAAPAADNERVNYIACLTDRLPQNLITRTSGTGPEVAAVGEFTLQEDLVSSVHRNADGTLAVTWSREGFKKIRELLSDRDSQPIMALKIDGCIEAIISSQSEKAEQSKTATFTWLPGTKRSLESLQAALRGPSISAEFELVK